MSTPAPEKIFPTKAAPGGPPAGPSGRAGFKLDQKTAMWGGAAVVALVALLSTRGAPAEDETSGGAYELDTTETDVYNDLQPELEGIADAIESMSGDPKAARPSVIVQNITRKPNKPSPKKKPGKGTPKAKPKPKPKPKSKAGVGRNKWIPKKKKAD